ncbi:hypothetical protein [Georgenia halophila]|uniref:hypothetical protein n=1 Tax=Georgenia halophila TaxID=620889 RepID=UPI0031EA72F0
MLVVAAESTPRSLELHFPPVFVAYEVLIFAIIPAVVTLGIVAVAALAWNASLPMWLTSAIAALTTATWLSFVMRSPTGPAYGLLFGLGGACAGAALGARWRLPVRLVVAAAIMALALLVGSRQ